MTGPALAATLARVPDTPPDRAITVAAIILCASVIGLMVCAVIERRARARRAVHQPAAPVSTPTPANDDRREHDSDALFAELQAEHRELDRMTRENAERLRRLHAAEIEIDRRRPFPRAAE